MSHDTLTTIAAFNDACNRGDLDAMMAVTAEDVIFENTWPPPDGTRTTGREAFRAFWVDFFRDSKNPRFETEEAIPAGDRCVTRWTYHWDNADGSPGRVRGVDVFRVKSGKVAEKLSYVKG
jgi:ketosteroid isomerase-like protein